MTIVILCVALSVIFLFIATVCCKVSGELSRQEEMEQLKKEYLDAQSKATKDN